MTENAECVVVSGGSRGLGLAIVRDLVDHGYRVATCSRGSSGDLEALREAVGEKRLYWRACQIEVEREVADFFSDVERWVGTGSLYALVNNAGIARDGIFATFPAVESERIVAVNLMGALRMSRFMLRGLLRRKHGGRIINISSIIGSRGYIGLAAYSASKAGLDGFTRSLAREVGRRQITVNSVAPGYLETEMSTSLERQQKQQIVNRTPLGRLGSVADVVPVVRFLLSPEAGFVTGQTIVIDGGITV